MELLKKSNTAQIVAFVMFALLGLMEVPEFYDNLRFTVEYGYWELIYQWGLIGKFGLFHVLGFIAIAVGFLLGNTKVITIGAGIKLWLEAIGAIQEITSKTAYTPWIVNYCLWAFFWTFFMIASIKTSKAKRYCTVSAGVYLGCCVILGYGLYDLSILACVAVFLAGITIQAGLKNIIASTPKCAKKVEPASQYKYENLIKLKELLDVGAITQEEFDEKKKDLLDL